MESRKRSLLVFAAVVAVRKTYEERWKAQGKAPEELQALWQAEVDKDPGLKELSELQRAAQWRLDFVAAENSMGFHAPQEMARILAESIDLSRQAQVKAVSRPGAGAVR